MAFEPVVQRMAPICVVQSGQDPAKAQQLLALKEESTWQRSVYVGRKGCATMPASRTPTAVWPKACATLLMPTAQF